MRRGATLAILLAALASLALVPTAAAAERLLAPTSTCPNQTAPGAPVSAQVRAMRCLVDFARRGAAAFSASAVLDRAAGHKSADILRCDSFDHEACGRPFAYWMDRLGYPACAAGENIAWGSGQLGSARSVFRSWMRSQGHRENILGPFEEIGIGLRIGNLEGTAGAHVWTQDFGSRDC